MRIGLTSVADAGGEKTGYVSSGLDGRCWSVDSSGELKEKRFGSRYASKDTVTADNGDGSSSEPRWDTRGSSVTISDGGPSPSIIADVAISSSIGVW